MHIRFPSLDFGWRRLHRKPHKHWQNVLIIVPRIGRLELGLGLVSEYGLLLPGRWQTRVSMTARGRVWRKAPKGSGR